jgi:hypothetical protein
MEQALKTKRHTHSEVARAHALGAVRLGQPPASRKKSDGGVDGQSTVERRSCSALLSASPRRL